MKKWVLFLMVLMGVGSVDARPYMPEFALDASCPKEKPFGYYGDCVGCDSYEALDIKKGHEKDFEICQNRITIPAREPFLAKSILKECPLEAPMRDHKSSCISCDTTYPIINGKDCNKCPNREVMTGTEECVLKECPPDKPLKSHGDCLSCNWKGIDISVTKEMCEKCPNTYKWYQEKCIPIISNDEDIPLIDLEMILPIDESLHWEFANKKCDASEPITTTKENCDLCPNREYVDGKCILKKE